MIPRPSLRGRPPRSDSGCDRRRRGRRGRVRARVAGPRSLRRPCRAPLPALPRDGGFAFKLSCDCFEHVEKLRTAGKLRAARGPSAGRAGGPGLARWRGSRPGRRFRRGRSEGWDARLRLGGAATGRWAAAQPRGGPERGLQPEGVRRRPRARRAFVGRGPGGAFLPLGV